MSSAVSDAQSPYIRLYNGRRFIQISNARNGVVSYVNKNALIIQRDSDVSFFLKNGDYVLYFIFPEIAIPQTSNITELISVLLTWDEEDGDDDGGGDDGGDGGDGGDSRNTTLEELRSMFKTGYSLLDGGSSNSNGGHLQLRELAAAGASSEDVSAKRIATATGSSVTELRTSAQQAGTRIVRQSRSYLPSAAMVSETLVLVQAALRSPNSATPANVVSRVGVFDDRFDVTANPSYAGRGYFIEHEFDSDRLWLVARAPTEDGSDNEELRVPRIDWNLDPLDGSGSSGYLLHPDALTMFAIRYDPARRIVSFGVLGSSEVHYCHEFRTDGPNQELLLPVPRAPVRWELTQANPASTDSDDVPQAEASMLQGDASALLLHAKAPASGLLFGSADTGSTTRTVLGGQGAAPLLSVRLLSTPSAKRGVIVPQAMTVSNTSATGICRWELVRQLVATNGGVDPYVEVSRFAEASSQTQALQAASVSETETVTLMSGYIVDVSTATVDLEKRGFEIGSDIQGNRESLTLRLTNVGGVVEALGSLTWYERGGI